MGSSSSQSATPQREVKVVNREEEKEEKYDEEETEEEDEEEEESRFFQVVRVIDGDTIVVKDDDNNETRVRLSYIDAPEKKQGDWGKKAENELKKLLPVGSKVDLINDGKLDRYKRRLSVVKTIDGKDVNRALLEKGLAVYYPSVPVNKEYQKYELAAKKAKRGIWSDPSFKNPKDFRKNRGEAKKSA